jgi:endonuclease/exonuclease/phosphatase family metal-dependent hydrolase
MVKPSGSRGASCPGKAASKMTERIDFVLFRGEFKAKHTYLVGDKVRDKTPSGLWPSDHAGVVARIRMYR